MSKVRTTIEIEDTYVEIIKRRYGLDTETEAVDLALRHLASRLGQRHSADEPMTLEEALAMHGAHAIGELPPDSPPRSLD